MKKRLKYAGFLVLITPICFELALRLMGHSAYKQFDYTIESTPKFCIEKSANLGFSLGEGSFEVTINKGLVYRATHKNGERITRQDTVSDSLDRIFLMGCSYTYGMGVDDSLSFPFMVQSRLKNLNIQNLGVPGFGTVQSYLQLKKQIASGTIPAVVMVNFCDFHHDRNSLTPHYRMSLEMGFQRSNPAVRSKMAQSKFPYVENRTIKYVTYADLYSVWPGRETFATINFFQIRQDERATAKIDAEKNSLFIFGELQKLCKKHDIHLIVNGLTQTKKTTHFLSLLRKMGIETHDISIDLNSKKYNSLPYDSHPNALAHAHFAEKISSILAKINFQ